MRVRTKSSFGHLHYLHYITLFIFASISNYSYHYQTTSQGFLHVIVSCPMHAVLFLGVIFSYSLYVVIRKESANLLAFFPPKQMLRLYLSALLEVMCGHMIV